MVFVITVLVVLLPILLGLVLAVVIARFDSAVSETKKTVEKKDEGYNPSLTLGHKIKTTADISHQLKEARLLAAQRAAATPRGANMRIGRLGETNLKTAWQGAKEDPMTAVKIAAFHSWQGVKTGAVAGAPAAAAPAAAPTARAADGEIELTPGKDYPYIEITDDMSPDEVRKARIANAKAKSAAIKAAKAAGAPAAAPAAAPPAVDVEPPKLIEITDDMSPDEVRKARIANAKAQSAYNKALKAAGVDPAAAAGESAPAETAVAQQQTPAEAPPEEAAPAADADVPKPDLIEISDDMSPDEVRKARISNAKAMAAYNKALKAAGIDPGSVN